LYPSILFFFFFFFFVGNSDRRFPRKVFRRIPEESKASLATDMMRKVSASLPVSEVRGIQKAASLAPTPDVAIKVIDKLLNGRFVSRLSEDALKALVSLDSQILEAFESHAGSLDTVMEWYGRLARRNNGPVESSSLVRRIKRQLNIDEAEARFLVNFHPQLTFDDEFVSAKEDTYFPCPVHHVTRLLGSALSPSAALVSWTPERYQRFTAAATRHHSNHDLPTNSA
jgi:hypothetical protein